MTPEQQRDFQRLEAIVHLLQARTANSAPTGSVYLEVTDVLRFTSPSSVPLFGTLLKTGDAIRDVAVVVEDGFNDSGATISVGTLASPNLVVAASDVIAQVAGEFRVPRTYIAPVDEPLFVFITPGTSTSGAFRVYFAYERA